LKKNIDNSKCSYTSENDNLSSSDKDKSTDKMKIQSTNEDIIISDSICRHQVKEHNISNHHSTEAMLQDPFMLQYGNLNVTDSSSSRPHCDDDYTNIVHHDNNGPDVSVYQQRHKGNDISASPQLTQLPNVVEKGHVVNTSKHLETSMASLPSYVSQHQQLVPPYHSLITTDAPTCHIGWSQSQHQQQPQQNFGYQNSGMGNPPKFQYSSYTNQQYFHNTGPPVNQISPTSWSYSQHTNMQCHDSNPNVQPADKPKRKKVFILHYVPSDSGFIQAVESLATFLREIGVDVSIDLFEKDPGTVENWSIWYENEISSSDVVLCIMTQNFNSNIKGVFSIYNLMSSHKDIAFRAVFLDSPRVTEYIPLSMQGSTSYCISSQCLSLKDEDFASLYALLTGQNRLEKPPVGKVLCLPPKRSKCKYIFQCMLRESFYISHCVYPTPLY